MTLDLRLGDSLNTEFPHADLVLTDPPWKYQQRFGATSAEDHYEGMEYEQIIDLLFERMSWSRLCMWITAPHLGSFLRRYFLTETPASSTGAWGASGASGPWGTPRRRWVRPTPSRCYVFGCASTVRAHYLAEPHR